MSVKKENVFKRFSQFKEFGKKLQIYDVVYDNTN